MPRLQRSSAVLPVLGLLLLAPVCAEYLSAYDGSTGHPLSLLAGLAVLAPLYGAPAVLIREATVRWGLGWPGLLLLATAAGLLQAGVWDQSLFSVDYRSIAYWPELVGPTRIDPLGISVYTLVSFVGGHVVLSFGAPIALVEGLAGARRGRPWLGPVGVAVLVVLHLAAAALILVDHLQTEDDHASPAQLLITIGVALALVGLALRWGGPRAERPGRRAPAPLLVAVGGAVAASASSLLAPSVPGTTALVVVAVATVLAVLRTSRSPRWDHRHAAALAGGALVSVAVAAFWAEPLGAVTRTEQTAHNLVALALVTGLTVLAARAPARLPGVRDRRPEKSTT